MQGVQISGVVNSRDSISQDADISAEMVLDDIFDGSPKEWSINDVFAADVGDQII